MNKLNKLINLIRPITTEDILYTTPSYENDVKPIIMLSIIEEYINKLYKDTSTETIQTISRDISKYKIITLRYNHKTIWLHEPFKIRKQTIHNPIMYRLLYVVKSMGQIKHHFAYQDELIIKSQHTIPLNIEIDSDSYDKIIHNELEPMAFTLIKIRNIIRHEIEKGTHTIGIFKNAAINNNQSNLRHWIGEYDDRLFWGLNHSINIVNLNSVVHNSVYYTK